MVKFKGCNPVWIVLILFFWFSSGGVACPEMCRTNCTESSNVHCDHAELNDISLPEVLGHIPMTAMYLDLSHNKLTTIPERTFDKFSNLIFLDLSNNNITNLEELSFHQLKNLQKLFLHHNEITRLRNKTFSDMPHLKEIRLDRNQISVMEMCVFVNTPNLQIVHLQMNQINNISGKTFWSFETVTYMDLSQNGILNIPTLTFQKLPNLETLLLNSNKISQLLPGSFTGLMSLHKLDLSDNRLETINRAMLIPLLDTVTTLILKGNRLKRVQSSLFDNMKLLTHIDMSKNEIKELSDRMLLGASLEELDLHDNKITTISDETFYGAKQINVIRLSKNRLASVGFNAFHGFANTVYMLDLKSNQITRLLDGLFSGMRFLQELDLANNAISYIEDGVFRDLVNLKMLDLSGNNLVMLNAGMAKGLTSIRKLYLHLNPLVHFEYPDFAASHDYFDITMNLTLEDVTDSSALLQWPYTAGTQLYWSRIVTCVNVKYCAYRPQPEFLAHYQTELKLENLEPMSSYYVCVNPAFRSEKITFKQCVFIHTKEKVRNSTSPTITVTEQSVSSVAMVTLNTALFLCSMLICILL
ncbi:Carboxypeptidase N [Mactra antiquata]